MPSGNGAANPSDDVQCGASSSEPFSDHSPFLFARVRVSHFRSRAMTEKGHEDPFPPPEMSVGCGFRFR
jgi:hypothetical protein